MASTGNTALRDQSGAALVVALIMIVVLTLIAFASSYTAIFEMRLSGNKRGSTDAFYAADSGVQVVTSDISNFNMPGETGNFGGGNQYAYSQKSGNLNPTNADITITFDPGRSGAPRGSMFSATGSYDFMYYQVRSTGRDQIELIPPRATCTIEEQLVRIIPKPEE
jgi:PilX N-terminal